jgi:hypothetical protein
MKHRPILFTAPMVRAILSGAKTQDRRPQTQAPPAVGDRLWVRETWRACDEMGYSLPGIPARPGGLTLEWRADWDDTHPGPWRPSIHMPRWASRITLDVVSVWGERLHDITEAGARAEGFASRQGFLGYWSTLYGPDDCRVWVVVFAMLEAAP